MELELRRNRRKSVKSVDEFPFRRNRGSGESIQRSDLGLNSLTETIHIKDFQLDFIQQRDNCVTDLTCNLLPVVAKVSPSPLTSSDTVAEPSSTRIGHYYNHSDQMMSFCSPTVTCPLERVTLDAIHYMYRETDTTNHQKVEKMVIIFIRYLRRLRFRAYAWARTAPVAFGFLTTRIENHSSDSCHTSSME